MNEKIVEKTEQRIIELMDMNSTDQDFNADAFEVKLKQARVGMQYRRDAELTARIEQGQVIRVVTLISTDPEERRNYIAASMPVLVDSLRISE